ncbi:hypothetical protein BH20ACT15_BH20ACT15_07050 [soil metagenome]
MAPLIPKPRKPWQDDPGHIHDSPGPPPTAPEPELPDGLQETPGAEVPTVESIQAEHATEEERDPQRDPAPVPDINEIDVPSELEGEIRTAMAKYPEKRSASIPALWAVQRRYGYCTPEGIEQAAAVMEVTPGYLQSVASFYDLFHLEPQGSHEVLVCTNISCWLRGADDVLQEFMDASTDDVTVRGFECLGACDIAPMASIDKRYFGPLGEGDAAEAMRQLGSGSDVLPAKRLQDREAAGGSEGAR